jgi:hypothetical protein
VEAVIVLPFFLLILCCVLYMRSLYDAKIAALGAARSQAWIQSKENCKNVGRPATESSQVLQAMQHRVGDAAPAASDDTGRKAGLFVQRMLREPLDLLFGQTVATSATYSIRQPRRFGMQTVRVSGHYHLVCNIEPKTPGDVAADLWGALMP